MACKAALYFLYFNVRQLFAQPLKQTENEQHVKNSLATLSRPFYTLLIFLIYFAFLISVINIFIY